MNILALNAGSSSLKYRLFQTTNNAETVLQDGTAEGLTGDGILPAAQQALQDCAAHTINAVGHRVVQGGPLFQQPTRITPDVLRALHTLQALDPLHNPTETAIIEAVQDALPSVPAVAVFDTSFHRTLPEVAWRYALPRALCDTHHLRRYGFHGISHQYVSQQLIKCMGKESAEGTRLITCHLGSGASVCAVQGGQSIDTSMGMTPLAGLVMGTRSGDIDPGLLLYLLREVHMTAQQLDDMLNKQSGLLGVSGTSNDVRKLEQSAQAGDAHAEMALALFAYSTRKYIGAYAAVLEGADAIAFAGGIGERSAAMRARICRPLTYLGLRLDDARNQAATGTEAVRISAEGSPVEAWVIPTDEQRQIAREVRGVLTA